MAGAGQGRRDAAQDAREAERRRSRDARRDRDAARQHHDETVRAAALQAATTILAPFWAPYVMRTEDTPYSSPRDVVEHPTADDVPESLNLTDDDRASRLDIVLALAGRFEQWIGEAGPPEHPALQPGPPDGFPVHPGTL